MATLTAPDISARHGLDKRPFAKTASLREVDKSTASKPDRTGYLREAEAGEMFGITLGAVGVPTEDIEVVGAAERHERLGGGHHLEGVVAAHAEPGTTATVFFTATEVGEYNFACTIPGHKEAGMVDKLLVTE